MTEPFDTLQGRVTELEMRLAYFEAMAEELSSVVADQGRKIDRLEARLQAARNRIDDMAASLPEPANDKPPPHY